MVMHQQEPHRFHLGLFSNRADISEQLREKARRPARTKNDTLTVI